MTHVVHETNPQLTLKAKTKGETKECLLVYRFSQEVFQCKLIQLSVHICNCQLIQLGTVGRNSINRIELLKLARH